MKHFVAAMAALLLASALSPQARAQVILTNANPDDLVSAIRAGGYIRLNFVGAMAVSNAIPISTDVTIEGLDRASNIISGSSITRVFVVEPTGTLRLRNVSVVSGRVTPATLTNGIIQEYAGAAIYNDRGVVEAYNTAFSTHTVIGPNARSGVDNASFDGEKGEDAVNVFGGAIFNNSGSLFLSNCIVHRNDLLAGAGGKGGNGGNFGNGRNGGDGGDGGNAFGGGIYSLGGTVALSGTYIATNSAFGGPGGQGGAGGGAIGFNGDLGESGSAAGALAQSGGVLWIEGSTFEGNRVLGGAGTNGLAGRQSFEGQRGEAGGPGLGGAIYALTDLMITNSTFVRNSAIGGPGGDGGAGGPTTFGSDGGDGGQGGAAWGGAILVPADQRANIVHSTFHDNILIPGVGGEGGPGSGLVGREGDDGDSGNAAGGALNSLGGTDLANSIFAFSRGGGNLAGNINDLGGNISSDASLHLGGENSIYSIDPLIYPLRGLISRNAPLMALRPGSPAIGRALARYSPQFDARGMMRDFAPDSGAYEFPGPLLLRATRIAASTNSTTFRLAFTMTAPQATIFSTTNLANPFGWQIVTNIVREAGTPFILDVPATNRMEFFRVVVP